MQYKMCLSIIKVQVGDWIEDTRARQVIYLRGIRTEHCEREVEPGVAVLVLCLTRVLVGVVAQYGVDLQSVTLNLKSVNGKALRTQHAWWLIQVRVSFLEKKKLSR